ncbi:hypothetical protein LNQ52_05800 [Klebsiella pneumoniae subsp. pneumoniae]|nr:hypothetical protein [Klebsiella pneumoniae subsp. pneumoniae]
MAASPYPAYGDPPVSPYTVDPASAAPPGGHRRYRSHFCAGWRYAYPAYGILT